MNPGARTDPATRPAAAFSDDENSRRGASTTTNNKELDDEGFGGLQPAARRPCSASPPSSAAGRPAPLGFANTHGHAARSPASLLRRSVQLHYHSTDATSRNQLVDGTAQSGWVTPGVT